MAIVSNSELVFACYSAACAPPQAGGSGGSLPGGKGGGGGGSSSGAAVSALEGARKSLAKTLKHTKGREVGAIESGIRVIADVTRDISQGRSPRPDTVPQSRSVAKALDKARRQLAKESPQSEKAIHALADMHRDASRGAEKPFKSYDRSVRNVKKPAWTRPGTNL